MFDRDSEGPAWMAFASLALQSAARSQRAAREPGGDSDGSSADARASDVASARQRFLDSLAGGEGGFAALAGNARLSAEECEVLAFVISCELDSRHQQLVGYLQDDPAKTRLTLQTVGTLLGGLDKCAAAVGPGSRLRRAALIEIGSEGAWAQQTVVAPAPLVWAFLGDVSSDPGLPSDAREIEIVVDEQCDVADAPTLLLTYGPDRVRRREAAMAALQRERFLVLSPPESDQAWSAVVREATMTGRAVVVELEGPLTPEGRRRIEHADHLAWALTSAKELSITELPSRPFREIDAPSGEMTDQEWSRAFGPDAPRTHRLTPQQAERVGLVYAARGNDLEASIRRLLAGPLESLAQRVRPRHSWDDLILSPGRLRQVRAIVDRYREASQVYDKWGFSAVPSRGLVALFSGVSGAGKTLAAEILAGELGLDMFKLDLSSVVSKYIGETEKNLDLVFDAAGVGNVVLFFDEADALFGKRSEVKDARDRYANIEVSYLLQRVEAFDGVVVLATNFEKSIDPAFLRRIHSRIDFVLPEAEQRRQIWDRHLPAVARLDDVDLTFLADNFDFSGGQIRNAAVHAGFIAASNKSAIGMSHLVQGAAQELRKAGRLLKPSSFGPWYADVSD